MIYSNGRNQTKTNLLISAVIALCFMVVMLPLTESFAFEFAIDRSTVFLASLIKFLFFFFLTWLIYFGLNYCQKIYEKDKFYLMWIKITVPYLIFMLVLLLLTFPGGWVGDEIHVLNSVRHYAPGFWQNYLTNFFYSFCLYIAPSAMTIILFQITFLSFTIGYVTAKIWIFLKITTRRKWLVLLPFLTLPVLSNNLYPLRLTMYSYVQLIFLIKIFFLVINKTSRHKLNFSELFSIMVMVAVLAVWRSEGVYHLLFIPLILTKSGYFRKQNFLKPMTYVVVGCLMLPIAILVGVNWRYKNNYYTLSGFFEPMQAMILNSSNLTEKDRITISKMIDLDRLPRDQGFWGGSIRHENLANDQYMRDLQKTYVSLILRNPIDYLSNRWGVFMKSNSFGGHIAVVANGGSGVFELVNNLSLPRYYLLRPINYNLSMTVRYALYGSSYKTNGLSTILSKILWNVMPIIVALLIVFVLAIMRHQLAFAVIIGTLLVHFLLVFLTAPEGYFMYYLLVFQNGLLFVVFYWLYLKLNREKKSQDVIAKCDKINNMQKMILIIPVYNCSKQLERVLRSLDKTVCNLFSDILVIDNISSDDTLKTALAFKKKIPNLKVFLNKDNINLGGSHKVGLLYAENVGAKYMAVLHGDDQAVANELIEAVNIVNNDTSIDAVLGTRFMKGSKLINYDKKRIIGNRILNAVYTITTGRMCRDLGSGLNVFKVSAFNDHKYLLFADKLTFNAELLLYLITRRAKVYHYPITWRESDQVSNARNFNIAWVVFKNLIKWRLGLLKYEVNDLDAIKRKYISKEQQ